MYFIYTACLKISIFIVVFETFSDVLLFISAFTPEQYQQHQQQLALMQKQQLAQIHQQQANNNSSANTSQVMHFCCIMLSSSHSNEHTPQYEDYVGKM